MLIDIFSLADIFLLNNERNPSTCHIIEGGLRMLGAKLSADELKLIRATNLSQVKEA